MTDGTKKSTYNAEAQKRYNQKRKKIACTVFNSYVLNLIDNDLKSDND